jgi:putative ATPase
LCQAPKSNAVYTAYGAALKDVAETRNEPVPLHLRNAPTGLMKDLGYGQGYKYAHDYEGARVDQEHFPPNLAGRRYYDPTNRGFEAEARARLAWRDEVAERRKARDQRPKMPAGAAEDDAGMAPGEEPQAVMGEESQLPPEDDGAQVRRPAAKKGGGKRQA